MKAVLALLLTVLLCMFLDGTEIVNSDCISMCRSTLSEGLRNVYRLDYARLNCGEVTKLFSGLEEFKMLVNELIAILTMTRILAVPNMA